MSDYSPEEPTSEENSRTVRQDAASVSSQALVKSRRQRLMTFVIWSILLLIAGIAWWALRPQLSPELGIVRRGTAISSVYGTVLVEPISQSLVKSQASGVVDVVKVQKGDYVKEGDVLAEITDSQTKQELIQAQNQLEIAHRALAIGPAAAPDLGAAQKAMDQMKKLLDEGNIAQTEYDTAKAKLNSLQDQLKNQELALEAAVQAAQQKVDAINQVLGGDTVRATQDGVILDFYSQLGQVIAKGEQMFLIGSKVSQIHAEVNEEDVGLLKADMTAVIRLYSFPGQDFTAKIKQILPGAKDQQYSVLLMMDDPPQSLLNGMTGELNIITGRHENALIVPTRAICSGSEPMVLTVVDGVVESREIKTAYRSPESTEVVSGLNEGDLIILSDQFLYKPGMSVKVVRPK